MPLHHEENEKENLQIPKGQHRNHPNQTQTDTAKATPRIKGVTRTRQQLTGQE
jgi:hypothetical protein